MNNIRQPRPPNYTSLCKAYQDNRPTNDLLPAPPTKKKPINKYKRQIAKYILSLYLTDTISIYLYTNKTKDYKLSIEDLAGMVGLSPRYMYKVMNTEVDKMPETLGLELMMRTRAASEGLFFGALEDRQWASKWVQNLVSAVQIRKKRGFPPLLVSEINKAFTNQMASNQNLLTILTKLPSLFGTELGKPGTNININTVQNNANQGTIDNQFLTTEMAIQLIAQSPHAGPTNPDILYLEENLASIEDVTANITDAQGRNNLNPKDLVYQNHEDRRTNEARIIEA